MVRKRVLSTGIGQRLLQSKLNVLIGGVPEPRPAEEAAPSEPRALREPLAFRRPISPEPSAPRPQRQYTARTVYLSDRHLRDLDAIVAGWQYDAAKRLTRSAVLRRAIEHPRAEVEAGAEPTLE